MNIKLSAFLSSFRFVSLAIVCHCHLCIVLLFCVYHRRTKTHAHTHREHSCNFFVRIKRISEEDDNDDAEEVVKLGIHLQRAHTYLHRLSERRKKKFPFAGNLFIKLFAAFSGSCAVVLEKARIVDEYLKIVMSLLFKELDNMKYTQATTMEPTGAEIYND